MPYRSSAYPSLASALRKRPTSRYNVTGQTPGITSALQSSGTFRPQPQQAAPAYSSAELPGTPPPPPAAPQPTSTPLTQAISQPQSGTNPFDTWQHFLGLMGAGDYTPGNQGGWQFLGGQWYRRGGYGRKEGGGLKQLGVDPDAYGRVTVGKGGRGFDLFGLLPQDVYWENIDNWGGNTAPGKWQPSTWWNAYANQSAGLPAWLQSNLSALQGVWGKLSGADQAVFRDRMLNGTGIPAYLQAFLKSRPQWITDYISQALKV